MQGDVVLPKVEALYLLQRQSFPVKLGFGSVSPIPELLHRNDRKGHSRREVDVVDESSAETFFNFPNLISMSRLVSGPFIGW